MAKIQGAVDRLDELPFSVGEVIAPRDATEVGAVLADATATGRTVFPFGGAISAATGHAVEGFDIGLDLTAISGAVSWEPADLVLSVRAGTTFADVQRELARHNQSIPVDVAYPERATIGGLIASGFAGPRRLRSGSFRDLLIGCEYVRGDGLVANAGGMVVKNVSGFEVPRFLHGSWGALAILTTVNLKVTPTPRSDGTFVAQVVTIDDALACGLDLVGGLPSLDACTVTIDHGMATLAVRALGRDRAVAETISAVSGLVGPGETMSGHDSAVWWQRHLDRFGEREPGTLLAISTRPRQTAELVRQLLDVAGVADSVSLSIDPGLGTIRLRFNNDATPPIGDMADVVVRDGAGYVLEKASSAIVDGIDPWGPVPDGIDIMRSLKKEFDPSGVLNRGRLMVS